MKILLIATLCALTGGCMEVAPSGVVDGFALVSVRDCGEWRCNDGSLPEQIVGEENHAAVLDGSS